MLHKLLVAVKGEDGPDSHLIHGGYANPSGVISLFTQDLAYRVNFKTRTIQEKPPLNRDAQARYDAVQPGESFQFCGASFRRLSHAEIEEICTSGSFRSLG